MSSVSKGRYYVWYLGWKEVEAMRGSQYTEPIAQELLQRREGEDVPKLTLELSKKDIKLTQEIRNKKGRVEKIKHPVIHTQDITFAAQVQPPDDDVIAVIYYGHRQQTGKNLHVHVYRCDSPDTAQRMAEHFCQVLGLSNHVDRLKKIERDLIKSGEISRTPLRISDSRAYPNGGRVVPGSPPMSPGRDSEGHSTESTHTSSEGEGRPEPTAVFNGVTAELQYKLHQSKEQGPLLLPPKDYDTICRKQGDLVGIEVRKSMNKNIVGDVGLWGEEDRSENRERPQPSSEATAVLGNPEEAVLRRKAAERAVTAVLGGMAPGEYTEQVVSPQTSRHSRTSGYNSDALRSPTGSGNGLQNSQDYSDQVQSPVGSGKGLSRQFSYSSRSSRSSGESDRRLNESGDRSESYAHMQTRRGVNDDAEQRFHYSEYPQRAPLQRSASGEKRGSRLVHSSSGDRLMKTMPGGSMQLQKSATGPMPSIGQYNDTAEYNVPPPDYGSIRAHSFKQFANVSQSRPMRLPRNGENARSTPSHDFRAPVSPR